MKIEVLKLLLVSPEVEVINGSVLMAKYPDTRLLIQSPSLVDVYERSKFEEPFECIEDSVINLTVDDYLRAYNSEDKYNVVYTDDLEKRQEALLDELNKYGTMEDIGDGKILFNITADLDENLVEKFVEIKLELDHIAVGLELKYRIKTILGIE